MVCFSLTSFAGQEIPHLGTTPSHKPIETIYDLHELLHNFEIITARVWYDLDAEFNTIQIIPIGFNKQNQLGWNSITILASPPPTLTSPPFTSAHLAQLRLTSLLLHRNRNR